MKANIHTKEQLSRVLGHIQASELPLTVEVTKYKQRRSLNQNALFHKWMEVVSIRYGESTGNYYSPEMWKIFFKELFLGYETCVINGTEVRRLKSTADCDTKQKSEFMEKIDHYCGSEFHIFLPTPNVPDEF